MENIHAYLKDISRQFATGEAREHSYRPALQRFLAASFPNATVINEPARITCGAPDLLVRERGPTRRPIGYVETKDIGDADLDGNSIHREQFDRYKTELSNIIFTDYLDFHFYEDGQFAARCRIAEIAGKRIVPVASEELERFSGLLRHFGSVAPKRIASPSRLAKLMAGKARLLANAVREALRSRDAGGQLHSQYLTFRQWLIHDLTEDAFADIYAQTITYAFFAARLHDTTPESFSRDEAVRLIPKTNPLLRRMFLDIESDLYDSIAWIVDDLVSLFAAADLREIMRNYRSDDPVMHFYEDFLAEYDPALRKQRGVWYTPTPVVRFIVGAVDEILMKDFGLPGGLADSSKIVVKVANDAPVGKRAKDFVEREMHRVQILDPSTGTATFLAEAIRKIYSKFAVQKGAWPDYVANHLLPRINGFEILMASYAMAHLKLDMLLQETLDECAAFLPSQRFRVFLTNSLEEHAAETGTLWAAALSQEAQEANYIKRDCPVMVVMGNPPYSVSSSNKGEWIEKLVSDYKKNLNEKKINLDDDYIKFIRLGQHYIDRKGEGILAYITNNSFLDGITHREMRRRLAESFDEIYILNLHGNARKKEIASDGSKDENVFDIMQGVSINIFVKCCQCDNVANTNSQLPIRSGAGKFENGNIGTGNTSTLATIHYADLWGRREEKYKALETATLSSINWRTIELRAPYYFFVPKDFSAEEEYNKGFSVAELFSSFGLGVKTERDNVAIHISKRGLESTVSDFANMNVEALRTKYHLGKDSRDWSIDRAKSDVLAHAAFDAYAKQILTRCFDVRWTFYPGTSKGFIGTPAYPIMQHMLHDNVALCLIRNSRGRDAVLPFVAEGLVCKDAVSSLDNCRVFPLYFYRENMGKVEKVPNLNAEIVSKIETAVAGGRTSSSAARAFLEGPPVATLTGHEFEGLKGIRAIRDAVDESFVRVCHVARHPSIGEVKLTRSGINDSLRHGFGRMKLAAFAAIPEIIGRGMVVQHSPDWKGRGYESFVVAAPVSIGGESCCAFVIINSTANDGYRFYLHEVGRVSEMKTAGGLRSGSSEKTSALSSTPGSTHKVSNAVENVNKGDDGNIKKIAQDIFAADCATSACRRDKPVSPEDIFHYIYAVLHMPAYRERYKEFLKVDFPRIPYPKGGEAFRRLASIGEKLVAVHLLKDPKVRDMSSPVASFPEVGSNRVEVVKFAEGRVRINDTQYFDNVPETAWNLFIGGYQPAQKWLKDRKGRELSYDDLMHYKAIIAALSETYRLVTELDAISLPTHEREEHHS